MKPAIYMDNLLPNGVVLPASIFDDRNYVEINDTWLAERETKETRQSLDPTEMLPDTAQN